MNLNLVYYGNETLKKEAEEVRNIDEELTALVDSMFDIMYKSKGIGLAAPQVDVSKRVVVFDPADGRTRPTVLVNPEIREFSDKKDPYEEGCLSVPGILYDIVRPESILVSALDLDGKKYEFEAGGLPARIIQHEVDHLNGILFIDHLEDYVQKEFRSELKKIKKMNKAV